MNNLFSVRIETLGCRLNQVESEALAVKFQETGFSLFVKKKYRPNSDTYNINDAPHVDNNSDNKTSSDIESVALCVLNTCTVTGKAEQKARRIIRLLLKECKYAIVLVTGCYAELESEFIESLDSRVLAFSGKKKDELDGLANFLKNNFCSSFDFVNLESENERQKFSDELRSSILKFRDGIYSKTADEKNYIKLRQKNPKKLFKLSSPIFVFHSRASLKVQDGCNSNCAYCRIRLARGHSISLPAEEAVNRIKQIEKNGANEVVLSGVNLAQYRDKTVGRFPQLLNALLENTNHIRIRISSLYPETITPEIMPVLKNERICPHFHLSLQSGSDKILKLMQRPYCKEDVINAITRLREVKDNPFIGCDIITGFPSESDEDFEQSYELCKDYKIPGAHVFPFSARPGTVAYKMKNQVPQRESGKRAARLSALTNELSKEYSESCIGKSYFAILEKPIAGKPLQVMTENYLTLKLNLTEDENSDKQFKGGEALFVKVAEDAKSCDIVDLGSSKFELN